MEKKIFLIEMEAISLSSEKQSSIFDQFMLVETTLFHFSSIPSNGNHFYI